MSKVLTGVSILCWLSGTPKSLLTSHPLKMSLRSQFPAATLGLVSLSFAQITHCPVLHPGPQGHAHVASGCPAFYICTFSSVFPGKFFSFHPLPNELQVRICRKHLREKYWVTIKLESRDFLLLNMKELPTNWEVCYTVLAILLHIFCLVLWLIIRERILSVI